MKTIKGISITRGIAIGKAFVDLPIRYELSLKSITNKELKNEIFRFENLITKISNLFEQTLKVDTIDSQTKEILLVQKQIIHDPVLKKNIVSLISDELLCLENAIIKHFLQVKNIFSKIKNPYLNQRAEDFQSISNKLIAYVAIFPPSTPGWFRGSIPSNLPRKRVWTSYININSPRDFSLIESKNILHEGFFAL